jgi:hypothetical protein
MFVQRHLNDSPKLSILKWLEEVTEWLGQARAPHRFVIRVGGQKYHWDMAALTNFLGRINTVDSSFQAYIHQYQFGLSTQCKSEGVFTPARHSNHRVTDSRQLQLDVSGDNTIILND